MATIPQNVAFEQARQELISCINFCLGETLGLKMYEMEILLRDLYAEVAQKAQAEYNEGRQAYENAVKAEEQQANETTETAEPKVEVLPKED